MRLFQFNSVVLIYYSQEASMQLYMTNEALIASNYVIKISASNLGTSVLVNHWFIMKFVLIIKSLHNHLIPNRIIA